jgi:hypothetical protein
VGSAVSGIGRKWDRPVGAQGGRLATEPEDVADFCDIDDDELMQCAPRRASRATPTLSKREMWLTLRGHSLVQGGSREACATPHSTPLRRYINDGDELEIKSKVSPLPPQATKSTRAARRQAKPCHAALCCAALRCAALCVRTKRLTAVVLLRPSRRLGGRGAALPL